MLHVKIFIAVLFPLKIHHFGIAVLSDRYSNCTLLLIKHLNYLERFDFNKLEF
jgi:hypothetical protein